MRRSTNRTFSFLVCWLAFGALAVACGGSDVSAVDVAPGESVVESIPASSIPASSTTVTVVEPDAEVEETAPEASDEAESQEAEIGVVAGTTTQLRLVDAGSEPRTDMRYDISDGLRETMVLTMLQVTQQVIDGEEMPAIEPPETVLVTDLLVSRNADEYLVSAEYVDAYAQNGDPAMLDVVNAALDPLIGVTVEYVIDDRGWTKGSATFGGAIDAVDPQTAQLMEQLSGYSSPVPREPVGVGAVWETDTVDAQGIVQTSVFTVVAIEGSIVQLSTVVKQTVQPGEQVDFGTGVPAEILAWDVAGSGVASWDLNSVVGESSASVAGQQDFLFFSGEQNSTIEQSFTLSMEVAKG